MLEFLLLGGAGENGAGNGGAGNDGRGEGGVAGAMIKSLRDVVEVRFGVEEAEEAGGSEASSTKLVCPVSGKTLGPGVKAVYLVPCGHAFAESAVREMPPGERCLQVSLFAFSFPAELPVCCAA